MAHEVKCRLCKKVFDTETTDFVLIGQKSYYHKDCYEEWTTSKNLKGEMDKEFWKEAIIDYLYRDVKMSIDFSKLQSQFEHFTSEGRKMTAKGIYFAIRYYYEIKKGDPEKAQGGIGIVLSLYNESAQYWVERENKKEGTLEAIIEQIKQRQGREVQHIVRNDAPKKPKNKWNLEEL